VEGLPSTFLYYQKIFQKGVDKHPFLCYTVIKKRGNPKEDEEMEKAIWLGKHWQLGIWWRKNWKFIGLVEDFGFGRYIGITFKQEQ
jgi:hypothetical protein